MKAQLRAGAVAAFARAAFNLAQPLYITIYAQFIPEGGQYNPALLRAARPLLYVEAVLMVGLSLGLMLAVWSLFDLMHERAPSAMRLSLVTAVICGTALFLVAGNAIARFDSLFLFESYTPEQQGFALHILDMLSVTIGHVMVASQAISTLLWAAAGWRTRALPRPLSGAGLLIGGLAIIFEFTSINLIGFLLHIPLFIWLGIVLWRMPESAVVRMSPAAIS
jgi:hypothetical protein